MDDQNIRSDEEAVRAIRGAVRPVRNADLAEGLYRALRGTGKTVLEALVEALMNALPSETLRRVGTADCLRILGERGEPT